LGGKDLKADCGRKFLWKGEGGSRWSWTWGEEREVQKGGGDRDDKNLVSVVGRIERDGV